MSADHLLAIDQGTTSTRALVYDRQGRCVGQASTELIQHYPQPGWVEHDLEEIWTATGTVVTQALAAAGRRPGDLAAIGLTNQRETTAVWERKDGRVVHRAIVWQDRRTAEFCRLHQGRADWIRQCSGLVLDPYFSATKLRWLLESDAALRRAADAGQLAAGTIDSFLIWRLTGGMVHATDVSNASRTLLLNLRSAQWDDDLCDFFGVPRGLLPEVRPSAADYGVTRGLGFLPDGIPIRGVAGDQQAALFGQGGFEAGDAKCTYGTGAFFLQHLGTQPALSRHRLVTSLAATTSSRPEYVLEGSIFIAGAAVQWLRDGLHFIDSSEQVENLAEHSDPREPIVFVPALVGLGAPHWVPEARGVVFGLTRSTTAADLARGALEGVALQVADLVEAAESDAGKPLRALRADGGMTRNAWFMQRQADLLGQPVLQAAQTEATGRGAAFLAGLQVGLWPDLASLRALIEAPRRFEPKLDDVSRRQRRLEWRKAVQSVIQFYAS